jgi:hypothetical protein
MLLALSAVGLLLATGSATADTHAEEPAGDERAVPAGRGGRALKWVGGAVLGLATHESGHLALDLALNADPYFKKVDFQGIPFFALTYRRELAPRERFAVASAGFWVQYGASEWILTRRPDLRTRAAPLAKGFLLFHVASSAAYSGAALARTGPAERDTRGMAETQGLDERWVAAAVFLPAALDAYRYFRPRSRWTPWASRGIKIGVALLVVRAGR